MRGSADLNVTIDHANRSPPRQNSASTMIAAYWRPILLVFLPFAAGYFLSYFFRTINAVIAGQLTTELGLDASHLGLMTSVYFLTFAAIQLPLGILLDRFGPRRVQSVLLLIAAVGAALFARGDQFAELVVGRALIGFGVAGALIAGLKAIVSWFPNERIPLFNGFFIMLGTLGAICATSPAAWVLPYIGWRGLLEVMAGVTAATALVILLVVPDSPPHLRSVSRNSSGRLRAIFGDRRFWRLAPLSMMCISTAWAVQGLWAGPWLADVDGLPRDSIVLHLFVMAVTLSAAALLLGLGADRLRSRGIHAQTILGCAALVFVAAESLLILDAPAVSYVLWAIVAGMGAGTVLSYSILAQYFPKEVSGRSNAALNVFHIGGAFVLQEVIGWIIDRWPTHGGHYPATAYKAALAVMIVLQIIAIIWFAHFDQKLRTFVGRIILRFWSGRMALDLQNDAFFSAAIDGLPKVADLIATVPEERRSLALAAAQRSYMQSAQALGYEESAAQQWASTVMSLLDIAAATAEMTAVTQPKVQAPLSPSPDPASEPTPMLVQLLSGFGLPLPAPAEQT